MNVRGRVELGTTGEVPSIERGLERTRPPGRRITVVTDIPPRLDYARGFSADRSNPSGFSPRLYHLVSALAERSPVELVAIHADRRDVGRGFVDPALPLQSYRDVFVGQVPTGRPGLAGRVHAWRQFLFGVLPAWCHPRRVPALEAHVGASPPALVVLYLAPLAHLALRLPSNVPVVCVLEEGWERLQEQELGQRAMGRVRRGWITASERHRAARLYRRAGARSTAVVAISEAEAERFSRWMPRERIVVLPHGIDCVYFRPGPAAVDDIDVGVFGNLFASRNAGPTLEAWRAAQAAGDEERSWRWGFVGRAADELVSAVAPTGALVAGLVPDVRPFYAGCKVVLVPATSGTGVKTTLLQAWAMQRPVVATSFAATGLPVAPGDNVLIADSPVEMVRQVRRLLDSAELRRRLAGRGRETVTRFRDIRPIADRFADLCVEAGGTGLAGR